MPEVYATRPTGLTRPACPTTHEQTLSGLQHPRWIIKGNCRDALTGRVRPFETPGGCSWTPKPQNTYTDVLDALCEAHLRIRGPIE